MASDAMVLSSPSPSCKKEIGSLEDNKAATIATPNV